MSLRVWLPLTKDLGNQGLDDVTITNNGATFDASGKLGGCYSFDGSDDFISLNDSNLYNIFKGGAQPFSICFWAYHADTTRAIIFGDYGLSGTIRFNIELNTSHSVRFYWAASPDTTGQIFAALNTWSHLAVVYDGTKICFYMNGELKTTYNGTLATKNKTSGLFYLGRDSRTGTTAFNGRLNDFRIYDHCLSPLEVKHISQGLILHYPLNRNGWGQENLIANSNVEKSGKGGLILYDLTTTGINTVLGKTMRISADIKSDMINSILDCYVRSSSSQSMCSNTIFTNIGTDYKRYSMTTICNTNQSLTPQWFAFRSNGSNGTTSTATFTIKNVKLEIGENTTPWSPASSDVLATTMGLNDNIEYDVSGYGNNGTRTGTFSWTSDTPKYNVSTIFTEGCSISTINNLANPCSEFSVGGWVNLMEGYVKNNGCHLITFNGTYCRICISKDGLAVRILLTNGSTNYMSGSTLKDSALTANKWNYFVITFKNGIIKIYINGLLDADLTANITQINFPSSNISIGQHGSEKPNAKVSDFRIYATALSAEDIKSLYNNSAYIDNQGNIYGAVYEEV